MILVPFIAEITLPRGASLGQGKRGIDVGRLEGKACKHTGVPFWPEHNVTDDRVKAEWIVKGNAGDGVEIVAWRGRAAAQRVVVRRGRKELTRWDP